MRLWLWSFLLASSVAGAQPLPTYPNTALVQIGGASVMDDRVWRWGYFTTDDSLQTVAAYFRRRFTEERRPVALAGDFRQEAAVSAFDTREGTQVGVVLREHLGQTVAFVSVRSLWPLQGAPRAPDETRARFTSDACSTEAARIDSALRAQAFRAVASRSSPEGRALVHQRGQARVVTWMAEATTQGCAIWQHFQ